MPNEYSDNIIPVMYCYQMLKQSSNVFQIKIHITA